MAIYKRGSRSGDLIPIRRQLETYFKVTDKTQIPEVFDSEMESLVRKFQLELSLTNDGVIGPITLRRLESMKYYIRDATYKLAPNQRVDGLHDKYGVTLHWTASGPSARAVVRNWNADKRGRVGTEFVIGETETLQCTPLDGWVHHINLSRHKHYNKNEVNKRYVGIELTNWGYLEKKGGKYLNWVNGEVDPKRVCKLDKPFRTFSHYQSFTDTQMHELQLLLCDLIDRYDWNLSDDLHKLIDTIPNLWFNLDWDAWTMTRVITTHSNFEGGKFDCHPDPKLIEVLRNVYKKYC